MNFARTFLDSIRQRVVSATVYVRDTIVLFVYGDSSIDNNEVHKPFPEDATDATRANEEDKDYLVNQI